MQEQLGAQLAREKSADRTGWLYVICFLLFLLALAAVITFVAIKSC